MAKTSDLKAAVGMSAGVIGGRVLLRYMQDEDIKGAEWFQTALLLPAASGMLPSSIVPLTIGIAAAGLSTVADENVVKTIFD
jgi:hypothetical protein